MRNRQPGDQRRSSDSKDTATFVCPFCLETLTLPVDRSAGSTQNFVYDCEICCRPIVVALDISDDIVTVEATREGG